MEVPVYVQIVVTSEVEQSNNKLNPGLIVNF